jgi:sortase A
MRSYQATQERAFESLLRKGSGGPAPAEPAGGVRSARVAGDGLDPGFVGRLEIPRLGLSAIVREGAGPRTLRIAVGHVPGTAFPGENGNVCLAAHRDGLFRGLGALRAGDAVRLTTRRGRFDYRVDMAHVVGANDVAVLSPKGGARLTLVTCYPFSWIGPAPRRYVVTATADGAAMR